LEVLLGYKILRITMENSFTEEQTKNPDGKIIENEAEKTRHKFPKNHIQ